MSAQHFQRMYDLRMLSCSSRRVSTSSIQKSSRPARQRRQVKAHEAQHALKIHYRAVGRNCRQVLPAPAVCKNQARVKCRLATCHWMVAHCVPEHKALRIVRLPAYRRRGGERALAHATRAGEVEAVTLSSALACRRASRASRPSGVLCGGCSSRTGGRTSNLE